MATAEGLKEAVESHRDDMVDMLAELVRRPALSPDSGGGGERARADWLRGYAEGHGFEVTEYAAPDERTPDGTRPNLVVRWPGQRKGPRIWVMCHLDVVPAGDLDLWETDPFEPVERDGRIYGRGTEDNGQASVGAFWALKAVAECAPQRLGDVALLYVADEETGSDFGIGWLLKEHEDLFSKDDLILVPDGGDPSGALVEVAEKGLLWIRFTVHGKQAHASMPAHGANAARAAAAATLALDRALRERYPESDDLFAPPESTFEPTKRAANVPNVNTIPGRDEFHFDCRVLPRYETQEAFDFALEEVRRTVEPLGCTAEAEIVHHEPAAPPTSPDAPVVRALIEALNEVRGIEGRPMGVGGGTVAALFRRAGYPAAVWSTFMEVAHSPNEFAVIDNVVADAQVYAHLFTRAADRAS